MNIDIGFQMSKEAVLEEVLDYLRRAKKQLEDKLKKKREEKRELKEKLKRLPSWKTFLEQYLLKKLTKLEQEIADLKEEVSRYNVAAGELVFGQYEQAISILDELIKFIHPTIYIPAFEIGFINLPNPICEHLLEIRRKLISLQSLKE